MPPQPPDGTRAQPIAPGLRGITNNAGNSQQMSGSSTLTGTFCAFSSAR
jgi:hypothetical protein